MPTCATLSAIRGSTLRWQPPGAWLLLATIGVLAASATAAHRSSVSGIVALVLPLYGVIALGVLIGRAHRLDGAPIAILLVQVIAPGVFLGALITTPVGLVELTLPLLTLALHTLVCGLTALMARRWLPEVERRLAAFMAGSANVGVLGVPIAMAALPEGALGAYLLCVLGSALYENTIGYYVLARGTFSVREAARRVARLPAIHAIAAGLALGGAGFSLDDAPALAGLWQGFKGAYVVLGLLTVGLALASAPPTREAVPLVVTVAIGKFGIWMLVAGTLLLVDRLALGWFGDDVHRAVLIYACLPCATCGIVFALQLDLAPARGAAALLASLAISLVAVTSLLAWLAR